MARGILTNKFQLDREGLGQRLRVMHRKWAEVKRPFENTWKLNVLFARGEQNIMRAPGGHLIRIPVDSENHIPFIVDNRITPAMYTYVARLIQRRPNYQVDVNNPDRAVKNAAKISEKFLGQFVQKEHEMDNKRIINYIWMFCCGIGIIENTYVKKNLSDPKDPGEHQIEVVSPFEMFLPPDTKPNAPFEGMRVFLMRPEQIMSKFGVDIQAGGVESHETTRYMQLLRELGQLDRDEVDMVLVRDYYRLPDPNSPDPNLTRGIHAIYADGGSNEELHFSEDEEGNPTIDTAHGKLPWTFSIDPMPGNTLWSHGRCSFAIPMQREINRIRTQIKLSRDLTAAPKVFLPDGSMMGQHQLTDTIEVLTYNGNSGARPFWLQGPGIPAYVMEDLRGLVEAINDVFAQHGVSQGGLPRNVRQVGQLQIIQRQDQDSDLSVRISLDKAEKELGEKILAEEIAFGPEGRVLEIAGRSGEIAFTDWQQIYLRNESWVLNIVSRTDIPRDLNTRIELGFLMHDRGLMGGVPGSSEATKALQDYIGEGIPADIFKNSELEANMAHHENGLLSQLPPQNNPELINAQTVTEPYYDHGIHIEEHKRELLSIKPRLDQMGEAGFFILNQFRQHIFGHMSFIFQAQQQAALLANPSLAAQSQREAS